MKILIILSFINLIGNVASSQCNKLISEPKPNGLVGCYVLKERSNDSLSGLRNYSLSDPYQG